MAAVSAEGSTVWVLMRRLNSSWSRSIALVVRALFHWLGCHRVKVKSRSPASSRLSDTALHLSRHLRMKAADGRLSHSGLSVDLPARSPRSRFATDSPLEGARFEPSVPRREGGARALSSHTTGG